MAVELGPAEVARAQAGEDHVEQYQPDEFTAWTLRVEPAAPLGPAAVSDVSARLHAAEVRHFAYGREVEGGRWTFAIAKDVLGPFDQVAFAVPYVDVGKRSVSESTFVRALEILRAADLGSEVIAARPPADAARHSAELVATVRALDVTIGMKLKPAMDFARTEVHRALLTRGLLPTDGPMYEPEGKADSYAIEVYRDGLWGYVPVPRRPDPVEAFDRLSAVMRELNASFPGSQLEVDEGLTVEEARAEVVEAVRRLREAGFEPGADSTLTLF